MSASSRDWRPRARRLGRFVFGDRVGLTLWLGVVVSLGLTWRVGFFITDTYAVANALVNVADGHLAIARSQYSLTLGSQPGLHVSGGRLYGRNYGQVFLALPLVWFLRVATAVAPLSLVLAGGWGLAILGFSRQFAAVVDRPVLRGVGSVVALGTFVVNALEPAPLEPGQLELAALQLSTLLAAAFGGVLFYRLVGVFHHQRVAVAGGVASVLALPVGFWASIPKRHVLVATLLVGSVYCFARSRQATGRRADVALAGAYVFASLVAWVHAFEGFFALAALGSVDLLTGGVRDRKRIGVILVALFVGLAPMLLTNAAISGNPLEPPRLLPNHGPGSLELAPSGEVRATGGEASDGARMDGTGGDPLGSGGGSASGDGSGSENGNGGGTPVDVLAPLLGPLQGTVETVGFVLGFVVRTMRESVDVLGEPGRLWHIFGRSGRVPGLQHDVNRFEMIDLTVLESAPLLGGLLSLPILAAQRAREGVDTDYRLLLPWNVSPVRQTDLLVVALGVLLSCIYLSRLPLFSQITMRYVVYATPFWLYAVLRLPPVHGAVESVPKRVGVAFGLTGVGGIVGFSIVLEVLNVALGEAMQFHALVNLAAACLVVGLVVGRATFPDRVSVRTVGTGLGVVAGVTATFLVLAGLEFFQYGPFALGVARQLSGALPVF